MKNIKKYVLIVFLLFVSIIKVDALSVNKNNLTIENGKNTSIDLYANVETEVTEINFTLVYHSDDFPAVYVANSGLSDTNPSGILHTIKLASPEKGNIDLGKILISVVDNPKVITSTINIYNAKAITANGKEINLNSQIINVNTDNSLMQITNNERESNNNTTKEENNLLEKIESKIIKLELKEDVFEYTINIANDIKELDLLPVAKDESSTIDITTQKIKELTNNQIIITVTNDLIEEKYIINIKQESTEKEITIDESKFNYTDEYKDSWIKAIIVLGVILVIGLLLSIKK